MKKYMLTAACVLTVLCLLTACQPTPEVPVVVGKDQDIMLEAAQSMGTDDEGKARYTVTNVPAPNTYSFHTTGANGWLNVDAEAKVILPECDKLPTLKVESGEYFTQEMVSGWLDYFFGGTPIYKLEDEIVLTKSEIESAIVEEQRRIKDGFYDQVPGGMEDAEANIKDLQDMYETAPETKAPPELSDGTVKFNEKWGCKLLCVQSIDPESNDIRAVFRCGISSEKAIDTIESSLYYVKSDREMTEPTMKGAIRIEQDDDIPKDIQIMMDMTLTQAKEEMQVFFDAAGVSDMKCAAAYLIPIVKTRGGYKSEEVVDYAIKMFYTRYIDGAPVLPLCHVGHSVDEYNYFWDYERLEVDLNQKGILYLSWNPPFDWTETLAEDTHIMGFDEAKQIFEDKAVAFLEARAAYYSCPNMHMDIDSIQLGLFRIKEQNTEGTRSGLYVPVWAFYGDVVTTSEYYEEDGGVRFNGPYDAPQGPYIVLAVNAIDGSIIDVERGY